MEGSLIAFFYLFFEAFFFSNKPLDAEAEGDEQEDYGEYREGCVLSTFFISFFFVHQRN
jgi:hypothetical protein